MCVRNCTVGVGQGDVVLGLKRSDVCFCRLPTEAELGLLLSEGVAAQWLERDRGQLATQAGHAGIQGASSLVPVTLWVVWSAGQKNPLPQESEADPAEHLAFEHLDPVDVSFDDAGVQGRVSSAMTASRSRSMPAARV